MARFEFEIVGRDDDRYAWQLVALQPQRDVILRSPRDYRTRKRTRRAIARFQEEIARSRVDDTTGPRFAYTAGVQSLAAMTPSVGDPRPTPVRAGGKRPSGTAPAVAAVGPAATGTPPTEDEPPTGKRPVRRRPAGRSRKPEATSGA